VAAAVLFRRAWVTTARSSATSRSGHLPSRRARLRCATTSHASLSHLPSLRPRPPRSLALSPASPSTGPLVVRLNTSEPVAHPSVLEAVKEMMG